MYSYCKIDIDETTFYKTNRNAIGDGRRVVINLNYTENQQSKETVVSTKQLIIANHIKTTA